MQPFEPPNVRIEKYLAMEGCGMGIYRIGVLGVTFFLVALCPRFDAALVVLVFGLILYATLWVYDFLKQKGKS